MLAGFLAPSIVRNVVEGQSEVDIYDEVYGLLVIAASPYSPAYNEYVALGGVVYTADTLLTRFDLKQTVTGENL